jgi:hypothetical protein
MAADALLVSVDVLNACQFNQTLGVQRDGALTEFIVMPREKLYPAKLYAEKSCAWLSH